ncbi:hypothetical protein HPG69_005591 [Diceros bicornis minor]|uniref:Uncharacterized protein n=1 Tax=Diceros bicornis minor TaxID=77932 RepID=A0A7J7EZ43_DICBM|nr:hypothetical protein HPG69_005591 [Diceros bicornis minor]
MGPLMRFSLLAPRGKGGPLSRARSPNPSSELSPGEESKGVIGRKGVITDPPKVCTKAPTHSSTKAGGTREGEAAGAAGAAPRARHASAKLSAQERAYVAQVWDLIAGQEAPFGAELLLWWGAFAVEMQAAWDKFLRGAAVVLTDKYR